VVPEGKTAMVKEGLYHCKDNDCNNMKKAEMGKLVGETGTKDPTVSTEHSGDTSTEEGASSLTTQTIYIVATSVGVALSFIDLHC
jgi:hypothetical protein